MKTAVILFNLGGPDKLSAVKKFLFNLFYDPAILRIVNPFRWILAKILSTRREKEAQEIYRQIGGKSPILEITTKQADLLQNELNLKENEHKYKTFIAMRYWNPRAQEIIKDLEEFDPDKIIFLPLYPQYSTTTTKSSFDEMEDELKKSNLKFIEVKRIFSYYDDPSFIKAHVEIIEKYIKLVKNDYRILFSAHSLPQKIIDQGDPYQKQVEESVKKIIEKLNIKNLDYKICYQSKVGPLKWLEPSTEVEIEKAAEENISLIVVPIAFVSDHSETLVELDIEYKELFQNICKKDFLRVEALNYSSTFIKSLSDMCKDQKKILK